MCNGKVKRRGLAVTAIAAIMLFATTTSMVITESVFAYDRNQARASANDCGYGETPTNVGCQNTDSQIRGDENSVALTSQQKFPLISEPPPPPPTGFNLRGSGTGSDETFACNPGTEMPLARFL